MVVRINQFKTLGLVQNHCSVCIMGVPNMYSKILVPEYYNFEIHFWITNDISENLLILSLVHAPLLALIMIDGLLICLFLFYRILFVKDSLFVFVKHTSLIVIFQHFITEFHVIQGCASIDGWTRSKQEHFGEGLSRERGSYKEG